MKKKYYKAFNYDLRCIGFQYEIGKTYKIDGSPILCERGFHFCDSIANVYKYYTMSDDTRVCEVEPLGEIVADEDGIKFVTNKIKIIKEIKLPRKLTNISKSSNGYFNSGNFNSGNYNSGNFNSGDCNSGNHNSGNYNSLNYNSGYFNSGNFNSGDCNSGDFNSGGRNSGNHNSGDFNSGNHNSGDYNSGDFNCGNRNSGIFNTDKRPKIKMFNKESIWTYEDWYWSKAYSIMKRIPFSHSAFISEKDMTYKEKECHQEYKTIGGYIKIFNITSTDKQEWWNALNDEDKKEILSLPNFDAEIFKECTGIDVKI